MHSEIGLKVTHSMITTKESLQIHDTTYIYSVGYFLLLDVLLLTQPFCRF